MLLDIIIPSYKNMSGLVNTLNMIDGQYLTEVAVTVVDDCSGEDYSDILSQFPFVHLLSLKHNGGPGVARNEGMAHTRNPYIMFIDCGDYLIKKEYLGLVIETIKNNPDKLVYSWLHTIEEPDKTWTNETQKNNRLHGRVFNRKFIEDTHTDFSVSGSRANEDIGFMQALRILVYYTNQDLWYENDTPIILYTYDENSITRKNRHEFNLKAGTTGMIENAIHTVHILQKNPIPDEAWQKFIYEKFGVFATHFFEAAIGNPKKIPHCWSELKRYYNYFAEYLSNVNEDLFQIAIAPIHRATVNYFHDWDIPFSINYRRILDELPQNKEPPSYYYFDY